MEIKKNVTLENLLWAGYFLRMIALSIKDKTGSLDALVEGATEKYGKAQKGAEEATLVAQTFIEKAKKMGVHNNPEYPGVQKQIVDLLVKKDQATNEAYLHLSKLEALQAELAAYKGVQKDFLGWVAGDPVLKGLFSEYADDAKGLMPAFDEIFDYSEEELGQGIIPFEFISRFVKPPEIRALKEHFEGTAKKGKKENGKK